MSRKHELGKGVVGCLLGLIIVVVAALIAFRAIPARIAVAELQDACEEQAERASLSEYTDEAIAANVLRKAQELKLPVTAESIRIRREGGQVHIELSYVVPLRFPAYTYRWKVSHTVSRVLF